MMDVRITLGSAPLDRALRTRLERVVIEAREVAEAGARAALEQLGVSRGKADAHLSGAEKGLRQRLRAHGRQLGDSRDAKTGTQSIDELVEEVAYEHWHRMLFARFLAENDLLMYPDAEQPVAVSLEECEELAAGQGAKNGWELASRYAARMLPQIFRPDSPVFELELPPEHQQRLEKMLADLPSEVFTASDSLGWVYQFWQSKKKDEVNASEVKIGAKELPAVTQLFTETYMVSFLLDNSLGAWWAARRLSEADLRTAQSEDELREKASLPGMPLEYLRFVKGEDGAWAPAAGRCEGWPERLSELRMLDPCCGSGHFLVATLAMLAPMRMELEGLTAREAVDAVLRENIHGLEIDQRCVELAAFAVALAAWRYPGAGGYRALPELNVACSGLGVTAKQEEWLAVAEHAADTVLEKQRELFPSPGEETLWHNRLKAGMEALYEYFQEAPTLGSLINPEHLKGDMWRADFSQLEGLLEQALLLEKQDDEEHELGVLAHGLSKAAGLLARKYYLVATNVPYLTRGKQDELLRDFCETYYPEGKHDLATVFLQRCIECCARAGTTTAVLPEGMLFLTNYARLREALLRADHWQVVSILGPGAFATIGGEVVKPVLLVLSTRDHDSASPDPATEPNASWMISGIDASGGASSTDKAKLLRSTLVSRAQQNAQLANVDARLLFEHMSSREAPRAGLLKDFADSWQGLVTRDTNRYVRSHWELPATGVDWIFQVASPGSAREWTGRETILWWQQGKGPLHTEGMAHNFPPEIALGRKGVLLSQVGRFYCTIYWGEIFNDGSVPIIASDPSLAAAIYCYCNSEEFTEQVKRITSALRVTNEYFLKVPFEVDRWRGLAAERFPNGLPKPYSDDPTQWIFHGHPGLSEASLQVAMARLLGYHWPAEDDAKMELSDEARAWVKRSEELLAYADEDGIVCIPGVRGEPPAAERLLGLLAAAYGEDWSSDKLTELLAQADHAGKTLETWLRDEFFMQHCKLFHHRPFIWEIWDGLRDGFSALVNYHKLDGKLLETLIYTYLGDWIQRQKQEQASGVDGAEERLVAAEGLKKRLELIKEGESPYDIFVRWKPLAEQPIGWDPDIDDGVRLNIRPFMSVPDVGKKGAGVLRDKPNIQWGKDRGKDVASAPWHPVFKGDRINDHHLTLADKRRSREAALKKEAG